jgi:hypothetical protein
MSSLRFQALSAGNLSGIKWAVSSLIEELPMIRRTLTSSLSALALLSAAPALAQDEEVTVELADSDGEDLVFLTEEEEELAKMEAEMSEAFSIFGEFFEVEPLTQEQEARLPLAQQMTDKIMPTGSFAKVMQDTMEPMMAAMMSNLTSDPETQLSSITGVEVDDLAELSPEAAQNALDILDPQMQERTDKVTEVTVKMVTGMFEAMEPFYREALSKSFAVRFEEGEMTEVLAFFGTPTGEKYALSSFMVHYDPQMMGVMEQMGPAMMAVIPDMMEEFAELEEDYPPARQFSELSAAERTRVAKLLEKSVSELDALEPQVEEESSEEGDAEEDVT